MRLFYPSSVTRPLGRLERLFAAHNLREEWHIFAFYWANCPRFVAALADQTDASFVVIV